MCVCVCAHACTGWVGLEIAVGEASAKVTALVFVDVCTFMYAYWSVLVGML